MVLLFILLYLLGNLAVGWWAARRVNSVRDFALAGRRLPLYLAASTLFATWFGSETVLGASSEFVEEGLLGVIEDPFGAALCLVLVGLFYARRLYRLDLLTFSDYYRVRYSRRAEFLSAIFLVPSYFGWIAAQLVAMGLLLESLTGMSLWMGIVLCTGIVVLYTYLGGMWAVTITDFVQTVMIVVGLAVVAFSMLREAGGWEVVVAQQPAGFFRFLPDAGWESGLAYFAAWITIGLGSIPQQDVFQRLMSGKSVRVAVASSFVGAGMYLVVALLPLLVALCGRLLYPELLTADAQQFLPSLIMAHASPLIQVLFFGALLSAILSTASGAILAPATVIAENLVKPLRPEIDDAALLRIMRLSVVGVALVSAAMAMFQSNIYELVSQSSALSLVSLFVPLTAGLYWRRANAWGAQLSMVFGLAVWLVFEVAGESTNGIVWGLAASIGGMLLGTFVAVVLRHRG
jgi:solute:Na+ symporter, SSS family